MLDMNYFPYVSLFSHGVLVCTHACVRTRFITVVWLNLLMLVMLFCLFFQSNLSGHKNIIGYVDSSLTHTGNGVYEVLLLMPYCRTHVLQIMNGR
jgi:hypothetical protein